MRCRSVEICRETRRRLDVLLIVVLAITQSTMIGCEARLSDQQVYDEFRRYRYAISQNPESSFEYFSRRYLAGMLNALVYTRGVAKDLDYFARSNQLFGKDVEIVHDFSVERLDSSAYELTLYFSNSQSEHLQRIDLTYLWHDGRLLIDGLTYDLREAGPLPSTHVDDFTGFEVPDVSDVAKPSLWDAHRQDAV